MTKADIHKWLQITAALLGAIICGTAGGLLFWYYRLPLAWMLGSMSACALAALFKLPIATPKIIRPPMTMVIGVMLGTSFHPQVFNGIMQWILPLIGLIGFLSVAGAACYFYFKYLVGFDQVTAYFSGMPGGLIDMVILGSERGGDERTIALVHGARVFLVVLCLPVLIEQLTQVKLAALAADYRPLTSLSWSGLLGVLICAIVGVQLAKLLRLPAKFLLGPMLISAILHYTKQTDFILPTMAVGAAQVVLGATIGCRFVGTSPQTILRVLLISLGSTAILLAFSMVFAEGLAILSGQSVEALMLAYSPGGLAEMSLVALALGVEVPFVILHHIMRVFLVIGGSTIVFRLLTKHNDVAE